MATSKKKTAKRPQRGSKRPAKSRAAGEDRLYTAQVRDLVRLMVENDLSSLEIVNGDLKVALGRGLPAPTGERLAAAAPFQAPPAAPAPAAPPVEAEKLLEITSPMVGTFYAAPSPDSEPYVRAGDRVTPDTVVCIVEAMKVMNEIKAECSGQIVDVAVANGQPVEFAQVLFRVKP
ncbi:MAG: acetyl-CoA carboxylase biotin carboxyl carrier protein [Planctomycetes bacterium]|nr:acetyl-CoA carboxylase biotin carboxyl carrier protein [Planctomycetota bacterium]